MQQPKHAAQTQPATHKLETTKASQPFMLAPSAKSVNKAIKPIVLSHRSAPNVRTTGMPIPQQAKAYSATDSVNNNVNQLIDQNSQLMQKLQANAIEQKRAMGLQNSTLAISAAQDAGLNHALSIARDDANIQSQKNLQANQFRQDDKNKDWQSNENSLNREHDVSQLNKQQAWQGEQNTLNREHDASQLEKQQSWQSNENTLSREHQSELQDLQRKHELGVLDIQGQQRMAELHQQAVNVASENQKNREFELDKQRELVEAEFKKLGKELDASNKDSYLKQSVQLRSSYDAIIQSIYSNPELTPEEQSAAIDREYQRYRTALEDLYLSYQTLTGMNEQPVTGDNDAPVTNPPGMDNGGSGGGSKHPNTGVVSQRQMQAPNAQAGQSQYRIGIEPPTHGISPPEQRFISVPGQPQQGGKQHDGINLPGKPGDKAIGGFVEEPKRVRR